MMTEYRFKMTIMLLMGLLMGAAHGNVVPQNTPIFYDNDTLLAPNAHGEMTLYTIVDPTWEFTMPGVSEKIKINITGTADKVMEYMSIHFPDFEWADADDSDLDNVPPEKAAQDDPKPNCNVFTEAPYPMASGCHRILKSLGSHLFNLGSGPRTCSQVQCRDDLQGRHAAIWWCNDDLTGVSVSAQDIADLAWDIIPTCIDYAARMSWTRGQIFHETEPWNVIVNGGERCR